MYAILKGKGPHCRSVVTKAQRHGILFDLLNKKEL